VDCEGEWVASTVTDSIQPGAKVSSRPSKHGAQAGSGGGSDQTDKTPDFGPNEYGDQSIVNSKSESTNQSGKPGQSKGGNQQKPGDKQSQQKSGGKKDSSQ
jgi:hypothetical protein